MELCLAGPCQDEMVQTARSTSEDFREQPQALANSGSSSPQASNVMRWAPRRRRRIALDKTLRQHQFDRSMICKPGHYSLQLCYQAKCPGVF